MTALLTRLRIAGFKSFAEPAALDILPGLTGIVGPNGCGKSNVVEALRWAMGETSARSLRGGEMDDVIFAGTAARASRNLAEVTHHPGAAGRRRACPTRSTRRRSCRSRAGSSAARAAHFRANGRELRARDVQTLFADLASGARSSAMVSQGRVAALVNAQPEERRQVLEEAAGITGLHARRHEAELKLRAAEANLTRAEDLRAQLDRARIAAHARPGRPRYRNISGLVRAAETDCSRRAARAGAGSAGRDARRRQPGARAAAAAAARSRRRPRLRRSWRLAKPALPGPREAEAEARTALERRRVEPSAGRGGAARARALEEAEARLAEIDARPGAMRRRVEADAGSAGARLAAEAAGAVASRPACRRRSRGEAGRGGAAGEARRARWPSGRPTGRPRRRRGSPGRAGDARRRRGLPTRAAPERRAGGSRGAWPRCRSGG